MTASLEPAAGPRSLALLVLVLVVGALTCAGFIALGVWQVERMAWKKALIARVERNTQAAPAPAPGPGQWGAVGREDEYRRLQVRGRPDYGRQVLVRASTTLGAGFWVLTPVHTAPGHWVFVNRGFVPPGLRQQVPSGPTEQEFVGLLRLPEPGGGLLQANQPAAGRWYSRDVAAIAAAQGLQGPVAPYFVDAQASPGAPPAWPRPGLTVLRFTNNHLSYAFTWFVLAAIMAAALAWLVVDFRRQRRPAGAATGADLQP